MIRLSVATVKLHVDYLCMLLLSFKVSIGFGDTYFPVSFNELNSNFHIILSLYYILNVTNICLYF